MRLSDFIRSLRISIAAEALAKGETVASAATLAGYSDAGYFKDVFTQVMKNKSFSLSQECSPFVKKV